VSGDQKKNLVYPSLKTSDLWRRINEGVLISP